MLSIFALLRLTPIRPEQPFHFLGVARQGA